MAIFREIEPMIIFLYLIIVNNLGFIYMAVDNAISTNKNNNHLGLPEKFIFLLAFLFGSVGIMIGMEYTRNKTDKKAFIAGIPMIFICQWGLMLTWRPFHDSVIYLILCGAYVITGILISVFWISEKTRAERKARKAAGLR